MSQRIQRKSLLECECLIEDNCTSSNRHTITRISILQTLCHLEDKCHWWTWVPSGPERSSSVCLLKSKSGHCGEMRATVEGTVSGPKKCKG